MLLEMSGASFSEVTAALIQVSEISLVPVPRVKELDALVCRAAGVLAVSLLVLSDQPNTFVVVVPKREVKQKGTRVEADILLTSTIQQAITHLTREINDWFAEHQTDQIFLPLAALNQIQDAEFEPGYIMLPDDDDAFREATLARALAAGKYIPARAIREYLQQYAIESAIKPLLSQKFPQ